MSDSMREAMEAAFDEAEASSEGQEQEETGGPEESTEESMGTAPAEEVTEPTDGPGQEEIAAGPLDTELPVDAPPDGDVEVPGESTPAPVSWTPAAREHWASIPPEAQAEIQRRERDIQQGLQQAAGHKKVSEEYFRTVQPFQHLIQAQGSTPSQAITNLMTTAAQLTQGSPAKKAEVVRNIINEYAVDITMLDNLLMGQDLPDDPNAPLLNAIDERLAPINSFMGQVQETRQQQTTELNNEAAQELAEFQESHGEFYEDLREDMADLLEMAANRGRTLSMEQAYSQAAAAHPEIGPILQQRQAAQAGQLTAEQAEAKRAAASSIRGRPNAGVSAGGSENTDTRSLMEELWDEGTGDVGHG